MGELTVAKINKLTISGRYLDGDGLYLVVREPNAKGKSSKSWLLRTLVHGKRTDIGLGSYDDGKGVGLAEAREKAAALRKVARDGGNPLDARKRDVLTYEQVARAYYEKEKSKFRSERHSDQWIASLKQNVFKTIGKRPFASVTKEDYKRVLLPIWTAKPHAAKRIKQRMQAIFDYAFLNGHIETEVNPLAKIDKILPAVTLKSKNFGALAWADVPGFWNSIDEDTVPNCLLRFIILTATRSTEARECEWSEFDTDSMVWIIPAERTKMDREHRIPLTQQMLDALKPMRGLSARYVFPSLRLRGKKPIAPNVVSRMLEKQPFTVHGMRSTFRDWCADHGYPRELAEMALAHTLESKVERAYFRSDLLERRKPLMTAWCNYVCQTVEAQENDNVLPFPLVDAG